MACKRLSPDASRKPTEPEKPDSKGVTQITLRPTVQAAATLQQFNTLTNTELDFVALVDGLSKQTQATIDGDTDRAEAMLTAQAHTLDAIFNALAKKAIRADYMDQLDRYLRLSLKAQSQCRATWEAVSAIRNPSVAYVKQANIAHTQQVNNGTSQVQETETGQNQLLEHVHYERMDTGTTGTAIKDDSAVEALATVHRTKNV